MTTKLFGEPVRRREDARLIIGKGRYLDDIGSSALAAAFVRSPHAHARIVAEAAAWGGLGDHGAASADDARHWASRMAALAWCTAFLMLA